MSEAYIISWCKKRGYYGRTGDLSHVLLDKGVLCVPDSSHEEFLSEYARGVVKGGKFSCVVEYKPKVFRMFYDLDIVATKTLAETMTSGTFSEEIDEILKEICGTTADLFDIGKTEVTLCVSNASKKVADGVKVGIHLTFSNIFVTSTVALHVRGKVLEKLEERNNPFVNKWEDIVDAAVHKGSGMRLPWASKPTEPNRVYVPKISYTLERGADVKEEQLAEIHHSFAATRSLLLNVSLRTRGTLTKLVDSIADDSFESPSMTGSIQHSSLAEYSEIIKEVEKAIPKEYEGRVTGVLKTEFVYMFRHSSKYCANVERQHHSSNTYFLVSRSGLRQCCYSRKVDFEEKSCPCAKFRGDLIELPRKVMTELFPETPPQTPRIVAKPMPADQAGFSLNQMEDYVTKILKPAAKKSNLKPKPKTAKKSSVYAMFMP
ncbi:DNA primase [Paramecium bursaria Chlorella virus AP110A]|nr:DNA primase [Paramecium bursaria Chlorella virus AP110A]